jgi:hypothetical protein
MSEKPNFPIWSHIAIGIAIAILPFILDAVGVTVHPKAARRGRVKTGHLVGSQ